MNDLPARLEAEVKRLAEAIAQNKATSAEFHQAKERLVSAFARPDRALATVKALVQVQACSVGCEGCGREVSALLRDYAAALGVEKESDHLSLESCPECGHDYHFGQVCMPKIAPDDPVCRCTGRPRHD